MKLWAANLSGWCSTIYAISVLLKDLFVKDILKYEKFVSNSNDLNKSKSKQIFHLRIIYEGEIKPYMMEVVFSGAWVKIWKQK